jgi:hypothetical protein
VQRTRWAFPIVAALVLLVREARADLTSWVSVGGGYSVEHRSAVPVVAGGYDWVGAFSATFGVGTTPIAPLVIGGVVRSTTLFGLGTDVGLMARVTTGGFSRGDWGVALDVGASMRWWRNGDYGRYPLQGVLLFGAPFGLQIAAGADLVNLGGEPPSRGGFALLEIDLLRLTLMRQGSSDAVWKNPAPAGGRMDSAP